MEQFKYLLSVDCADQTLGIVLIRYSNFKEILEQFNVRVKQIKANNIILTHEEFTQYIDYTKHILSNRITIVKTWLFKLLPDQAVRGTKQSVRFGRLRIALANIDKYLIDQNIKINTVLLEYQMGDLSRDIYDGIVYHYQDQDGVIESLDLETGIQTEIKNTEPPKINIIEIHPTCKNAFWFDSSIKYSVFLEQYKTLKSANKAHTTENFKYFIENIQKKQFSITVKTKLNHLADAFMQAYYYIIFDDRYQF